MILRHKVLYDAMIFRIDLYITLNDSVHLHFAYIGGEKTLVFHFVGQLFLIRFRAQLEFYLHLSHYSLEHRETFSASGRFFLIFFFSMPLLRKHFFLNLKFILIEEKTCTKYTYKCCI